MDTNVQIAKGLSYTKQDYINIAKNSRNILHELKKNKDINRDKIVLIYGVYYTALIGMIRAGSLCRRETADDGFPQITIVDGNDVFHCRESVVYGIIGEDAQDLISPYEDTFKSYVVSPSFQMPMQQEINPTDQDLPEKKNDKNRDIKRKKSVQENTNEQTIAELEKKYTNEINTQKQEYEKRIAIIQAEMAGGSDDKDSIIIRDLQNTQHDLDAKLSAEKEISKMLQKKVDQFESETEKIKKEYDKKTESLIKEAEDLQQELDEIERQSQKYTYNPNYDHYYNDLLPAAVKELEFDHTDILITSSAIIAIIIGYVMSFLFLI